MIQRLIINKLCICQGIQQCFQFYVKFQTPYAFMRVIISLIHYQYFNLYNCVQQLVIFFLILFCINLLAHVQYYCGWDSIKSAFAVKRFT